MKNIIIAAALTLILSLGYYYFKPESVQQQNYQNEQTHSHEGEEPHSH